MTIYILQVYIRFSHLISVIVAKLHKRHFLIFSFLEIERKWWAVKKLLNLSTVVAVHLNIPNHCRTTFCTLFARKIRLRPWALRHVNMKMAAWMPEQIVAACDSFTNRLKLESFQYISAGKNFCNANQPVNLPWRIHFDLVNRSTEGAISTICKNQELCFITTLNKGVDKLKVKYTKTAWTLIYSM